MAVVGLGKIASALNLSERRVQQLVKEGLPRESRGRYDPIKCIRFYIRYLQNLLEKSAFPIHEGGLVGEGRERVRLISANADLKEMELAKWRGSLVSVQDVEKATEDLVRTTRAVIMAIAPRVAPGLVGETSRVMVQAKMEKACKEALTRLAHLVDDCGKTFASKGSS